MIVILIVLGVLLAAIGIAAVVEATRARRRVNTISLPQTWRVIAGGRAKRE